MPTFYKAASFALTKACLHNTEWSTVRSNNFSISRHEFVWVLGCTEYLFDTSCDFLNYFLVETLLIDTHKAIDNLCVHN